MRARRAVLLALVGLVLGAGCDAAPARREPAPIAPASGGRARLEDWLPPASEAPPAAAPHGGDGAGAPGGGAYAGTVTETMRSGGYTYALLDTPEGPLWVAMTQRELVVGARVSASGMVMRDFHSNTLERTFERLVLASSVEVVPPAP